VELGFLVVVFLVGLVFLAALAGIAAAAFNLLLGVLALIRRGIEAVFRGSGVPRRPLGGRQNARRPQAVAADGAGRPCGDPQCRMVNVPTARFCAQCGRRLA